MNKLEIKDIHTYLISSIDVSGGNTIVRDIASLQYKVTNSDSFNRLEIDWRNYKNNQTLIIISVNLLDTHQEVYFEGKPLKIKEEEPLKKEVKKDETKTI